jgi:peptide/nickel transport system permease protein
MINENRIGLEANPWAVVVPTILIAILTVGMNTFTDAVARAALGVDRPIEEQLALSSGLGLEGS